VRGNGLPWANRIQNSGVNADADGPISVLVAVQCAPVREALVAMLGALDGFVVVAEAETDEQALQAARSTRPRLALIDQELSGCAGCWLMGELKREHLVDVVVGIGLRADAAPSEMAGAMAYVQIGVSPRELLSALELAMRSARGVEADQRLLTDAHAVLDEPALVDL
jgi:DNA-binding NarL/FixJ family response regulator